MRPRTLDLEVSVDPIDAIRALRLVVDQAGWAMRRQEGARMVDRFAIIMPMTQSARTLGLELLDGPLAGGTVTAWSETRGTTGQVHRISWLIPGGVDRGIGSQLLHAWVHALPRAPWRWTFRERSAVGFLLPTWRRSRRAFDALGFRTAERAWPQDVSASWPPASDEEA